MDGVALPAAFGPVSVESDVSQCVSEDGGLRLKPEDVVVETVGVQVSWTSNSQDPGCGPAAVDPVDGVRMEVLCGLEIIAVPLTAGSLHGECFQPCK